MCNFHYLLLTQPLHSSEQHTRANLEFSSNFGLNLSFHTIQLQLHEIGVDHCRYIELLTKLLTW